MSITKLNSNATASSRIESLNDQTLELNGLIAQATFNKVEMAQLYTDTGMDRKYTYRNTTLGNDLGTYTSWTHLKAEIGYSIWKFTPTNYGYDTNNQLYFDNKLVTNKYLADSESATGFGKVWFYEGDSGIGYTDYTTEASSEGGTAFSIMNSQNDYLYLGLSSKFSGTKIEFQTRGSGYTLVVEYYNASSGDGWVAMTANTNTLDDDTSNFESDGRITWTSPNDWATTTVNGSGGALYYVRISSTTASVTTAKAYYIVPGNSVVSLLALSSQEILDESWAWCSFSGSVYVTIRNSGNSAYEGTYFITSTSSTANLQNFFIYNHEYSADYKDSTYVATSISSVINDDLVPFSHSGITATTVHDAIVEVYNSIVSEQLWDLESGNTIIPQTAGRDLNMGSGDIIGASLTVAGKIRGGETTATSLFLSDLINFASITTPSIPPANNLKLYSSVTQGHTRPVIMDDDGIEFTINRDNVFIVRNTSGSDMTKGQAVYITGSTGNVPNVALAKANSLTTLPAIGLLAENIANNAFGNVYNLGHLVNFDTSSFSTGDRIYVSAATAGALTNTRPVSPNYAQRMGNILVSGVGNGSIHVTTAPFIGGEESWTASNTYTFGTGTFTTLTFDAGVTDPTFTFGSNSLAITNAATLTTGGNTLYWATGTDVAVTDGGTGTSTGSITGTGALTFTAGGTAQNVTLTPSTTGYTILNGNVGIGTTGPTSLLNINGKDGVNESLSVVKYLDPNGGVSQYASRYSTSANISTTVSNVNLRSFSIEFYKYGVGRLQNNVNLSKYYAATSSASQVDSIIGSTVGIKADTAGSAILNAYHYVAEQRVGSGTINNVYGFYSEDLSGNGTNTYALYIADQATVGANKYAIYSAGGTNYLGGNVGIGITNPTARLDLGSGNLLTTGNARISRLELDSPDVSIDKGSGNAMIFHDNIVGSLLLSSIAKVDLSNLNCPSFQIDVTNTEASFGGFCGFEEYDNGNSSTADTIDWGISNKQKSTLTGNCVFTFVSPASTGNVILKLVQGGSGSYTVTWPSNVKWPSGTAPTLSTAVGSIDIIAMYFDGFKWYGNASLAFS